MILDDVIEFLKKTPPFTLLDDTALKAAASSVSMEFHPAGHTILQQDGPAPGHLGIIRSGEVKVFLKTGEGEEVLIDYLKESDSFGLLSLLGGDISRDNAVAIEDTVCYLIGKETVFRLIEANAAFSAFYLRSFVQKILDMLYREMHDRSMLYGGGDKMLFTVTLNDLISGKAITAPQDIPIREAAERMSKNKISSLVLLDPDGFPAGIITDRDLRDKVVAKGRDIADPVSAIMSVTLIKSEARDYCFEALLKMIRYNIHHVLVVNRGDIRGIITNHDLMLMQGVSPLSIAREIEGQRTIDGLVPVSKKINRIITILIKEGARASNITRIITEINDRLLRKILEITERKSGQPPVPYCWIVFGSEGRKEQTFKTDQDNAIIYEDPAAGEEEAVERYFSDFTLCMKDALVKCGFPVCAAGYMAGNPRWRRPLKAWKGYFSAWISEPVPGAMLLSLIFFDFRPVYGAFTLSERLRAYLGHVLKNQNMFLANMADGIAKQKLPLGAFRTLVVEKSGRHKDRIDIKINGLSYIVDIARLFALETGVYNTSTIERLRESRDRQRIAMEFCSELEQAFEFFMTLRLRRQFGQMLAGAEPDNFINPKELSILEQKTLEESFKIIAKVQDSIRKRYSTWS